MGTIGRILPYINGFVMVLKELIKLWALMVGYKAPETNLEDILQVDETAIGGIADNLGRASRHAKELRKTLMSFDVLNVIQTPTATAGGGGGGGGLPTIDPKILNALSDYEGKMKDIRMRATEIRDKIMEWLGFTKKINPLTGEISWDLKKGYSNLKLIGGIIGTLIGLSLITKIIKLIGWLKKLWTVFKTGEGAVTSFQSGIGVLGRIV